jgi:hypothetical protein
MPSSGEIAPCRFQDTQDPTKITLPAGGTVTASLVGEVNAQHLDTNATGVGFYGTTPIAKQTGVAVSIAAVHAALVALGLIGV